MEDLFEAIYPLAIIGIIIFRFYKKIAVDKEDSRYKRKSVDPYDKPELESTDFDDTETISDKHQSLEEEYEHSAEYQDEKSIVNENTDLDKREDDRLARYDEITDHIEDKEDIYDEELEEERKSPVPEINADSVAQGLVMAEILQPPRAKQPHRYFSRK